LPGSDGRAGGAHDRGGFSLDVRSQDAKLPVRRALRSIAETARPVARPGEVAKVKRRTFLDWLIGAAGAALGAFVLYPVLRYLVPPKAPEAATRRVVVAKKDEVPAGGFKIFPFGGEPGILIRTADGEYRAFTAVCTHLGCTVQFRAGEKAIWCACHNGRYDLEGRNVSGPPPRPLERFDVHVVGGEVVVEKAKTA
jgi:cytochrome b6-f complex iron-sulfur subunit